MIIPDKNGYFAGKILDTLKETYMNSQHMAVIVCVHTALRDVAIERRNDVTILFWERSGKSTIR
jgi:hypothetical protein